MTAATPAAAGRPRPRPLAASARLLRLELRRNPVPWLLPLLAVLFWVSTYRPAMSQPPLWSARSAMLQSQTMLVLAPLLAGVAAWAGSREGRRGITDLVAIAGLPRWAGRLVGWAAITCWAEAAYLTGVAVVFGVTAHQASWGGPLWWPVAVGAATAAASCAIGFAAGSLAPSRFTAPLTAVVVFFALGAGALAIQHGARATYSQIWPLNVQGAFPADSFGIFYPYLPDLAVAQLMFIAGLGAVALGALGLPAVAGSRWLRAAAAVVVIAGLGTAGTAVGLAGTARLEAHGIVIPALHDAASDRPVPYTPVCSSSPVPVCLQPAFRAYLPDVTAAMDPLLSELAGLPGAPERVTQVAVTSVAPQPGNGIELGGPVLRGGVLYLPLTGLSLPDARSSAVSFIQQLRGTLPLLLDAFVGIAPGGSGPASRDPGASGQPGSLAAQAAIASALARAAGFAGNGSPQGAAPPGMVRAGTSSPSAVAQEAAASRFSALPAVAQHAWLVTHLAALRAGEITISEIP
jgi:hypothetical protein